MQQKDAIHSDFHYVTDFPLLIYWDFLFAVLLITLQLKFRDGRRGQLPNHGDRLAAQREFEVQ